MDEFVTGRLELVGGMECGLLRKGYLVLSVLTPHTHTENTGPQKN